MLPVQPTAGVRHAGYSMTRVTPGPLRTWRVHGRPQVFGRVGSDEQSPQQNSMGETACRGAREGAESIVCQFTSVLRSGTLLQVGEEAATLGQDLVALVARSRPWLRRSLVITAEGGGQGGSPRALLRL